MENSGIELERTQITHTKDIKGATDYTLKGKAHNDDRYIRGRRFLMSSGLGCTPKNAAAQMKATCHHFHIPSNQQKIQRHTQSFNPKYFDYRNPKSVRLVHKMGVDTAKSLYPHHQVLVITQADTKGDNAYHKKVLHNHIIACMIDYRTGKSLSQSERSWIHIAPKADKIVEHEALPYLNINDYQSSAPHASKDKIGHAEKNMIESGRYSWKHDLKRRIRLSAKHATNINDFIKNAKANHIIVTAKTRSGRLRAHIKYQFKGKDGKDHFIRDRKLGTDFGKKHLLSTFKHAADKAHEAAKVQEQRQKQASKASHDAELKAQSVSASRAASASATQSFESSIKQVISEDKASWPSKSASMETYAESYFNSASASNSSLFADRKDNYNDQQYSNHKNVLQSPRKHSRVVSRPQRRNIRPVKSPRLEQAIKKSERQTKARSIEFPKAARSADNSPLDNEIQTFGGQVSNDENNVKQQQEAVDKFQNSFRPSQQEATTLSALFSSGWQLIRRTKKAIKRAKWRVKSFAKSIRNKISSFANHIKNEFEAKHQRKVQRHQEKLAKDPTIPVIEQAKYELYVSPSERAGNSSKPTLSNASASTTSISNSSSINQSNSVPSSAVISSATPVSFEIDLTKGIESSSSSSISTSKNESSESGSSSDKSSAESNSEYVPKKSGKSISSSGWEFD